MATLIRLYDAKSPSNFSLVARPWPAWTPRRLTAWSTVTLELWTFLSPTYKRELISGTDNLGILLARGRPGDTVETVLQVFAKARRGRLFWTFSPRFIDPTVEATTEGIRHLTERLLEALSAHQRIDAIPRLIALPILANLNNLEELEYENPFLFLEIERNSLSNMIDFDEGDLDRLIKSAASDESEG